VKRIVVGYDGSEGAQRALDRAADLAQAFGSELIVASVITPVDLVPVGETVTMPLAPLVAPAIDPELEAERWQEIADEARRRLGERGLTAEIVSPVGDAANEIVDVAEERDADLIVVGTHEPGFLDRLLARSVSQGVARRAHCDVLIVHPGS
jgi:nucleotide-binding universal stress UspA family protein